MILTQDKLDFLGICDDLLDKLGTKCDLIILGRECQGTKYEDSVVYIAVSDIPDEGQYIEIMRKYNSNVVVYTKGSEVIRFDREYIYILEHITKLIEKTVT